MTDFSKIALIYNPNSTGPSKQMAQDTAAALKEALPSQPVELIATEFAKHGEELAYKLTRDNKRPLVVSVSGDGGYNEIVNGIMNARTEGKGAVAGLLPGGNANDHYHSLNEGDFVESVLQNNIRPIDLLTLTTTSDGKPIKRYAHSYIGFGLTPKVGRKLTETDINPVNEKWIVAKYLFTFRHTTLIVDGMRGQYDSLVMTNVGRMAKIMNLAQESDPADGKFEISVIPRQTKLHLLASLLRASTTGLYSTKQTDSYTFRTVRPTLAQLDGEILTIDANADVRVSIERQALECIV